MAALSAPAAEPSSDVPRLEFCHIRRDDRGKEWLPSTASHDPQACPRLRPDQVVVNICRHAREANTGPWPKRHPAAPHVNSDAKPIVQRKTSERDHKRDCGRRGLLL